MAKTSISSGVKLFQSSMKYRPKRSIVFCSWGSEEHGLIGSEEFVEGKDLRTTNIFYKNNLQWTFDF